MVVWLSPDDAISAIESAKATGVTLLGFDGAYLRGDSTQPSMEDSRDYSIPPCSEVPDPYGDAIQFIRERTAKGLHFEIVLGQASN